MRILGANYLGNNRCAFTVYAPLAERLSLSLVGERPREIELQRSLDGYFQAFVEDIEPAAKYFLKTDNRRLPDPASFYQPEDVFGPSCVVDHALFDWQDGEWRGLPLKEMIMYELHVGTFTPEGSFAAAIRRLDDLVHLGITAVEIMPVAQFPGKRNWGYDGVFPFAVQQSYGGPAGLKAFVNACHQRGLAVILDVVYNHLGPEGNVLAQYMPVFTDKYRTPWGNAINLDDAYSDGIRDYFIQNALYWFEHYHIDALRLDAVHGLFDMHAKHFLRELAQRVEDFSYLHKRKFYLIAESDLNDRRIVLDFQQEGFGLDSQWSDDFHHAVHAVLTRETAGYYRDFGAAWQIAQAIKDGFVYTGQYSSYRNRSHGSSSQGLAAEKFVVCLQNHDQVGNRFKGERLSSLVSFEAQKVAAGALLCAPYLPLLFMGEEYGEEAPFTYFVSFHDAKMNAAVREGRCREFEAFGWKEKPLDPSAEDTFLKAKLDWDQRAEGRHKVLLSFYTKLIALRKNVAALGHPNRDGMIITVKDSVITVTRRWATSCVHMLMNFGTAAIGINSDCAGRKLLDSCDSLWMGSGEVLPEEITAGSTVTIRPLSFILYECL